MIGTMFKVSKWLFISVVVLIVVIFLAVLGLLYSQSGLRLATWGAEKALPELSIADASGTLGQQFTLSKVEYHQADHALDLSLDSVTLAIDAKCLFQPAICVDSLVINGLSLSLPQLAESTDNTPPAPMAKVIQAPLPIRLNGIELNNISLDVLGNKVAWKQFSTGVTWRRSQLSIAPTQWKDIDVHLAQKQNIQNGTPAAASSVDSAIKLPDVWIPIDLDLTSFDIKHFTLYKEALQQDSPIVVNQLHLAAHAHQHDVEIKSLELDMPEIEANTKAKVSLSDGYPLDAQLAATLKMAQAKGQTLQTKLSGSVEQLNVELALGGRATGNINAKIEPLLAQLPFDVSVSQLHGQWPLVVENSDYQATIPRATIVGSLKQFKLDIQGQVEGRAIPDAALSIQGQGSQNDIQLSQLEVQTLGGEVKGTLDASWKDAIKLGTNIHITNLQPDKQWPEVPGVINGELGISAAIGNGNVWEVEVPKLDIHGDVLEYPLDINGVVSAFQHKGNSPINVTTSGLTLAHGSNKLYATGRLSKQWNMDVMVNMPQLSKSVKGLMGKVQGKINLRGAMDKPSIDFDLNGSQIQWQDLVKIGAVALNGDIQPLPHPGGDVTMTVNQIDYQDQHLDTLALEGDGNAARHYLTLSTTADWGKSLIALNGELDDALTRWQGSLTTAELSSQSNKLYLDKPTAILANITQRAVTVDPHCWRDSDASLCLKQRSTFSAQAAKAQWALTHFDFKQIARWLPVDTQLTGQADANVDVDWHQGLAPKVKATVQLAAGQVTQTLSEPITIGWNDIVLDANLANNTLTSSAQINLTDNGNLDLRVDIADVTREDKQLNGSLALKQLTLDALAPLTGEYSNVNSTVNSQLKIKGSILHPKVFGQLTVSDIIAQGEISPVDVNSGQLTLDFAGYKANLTAQLNTADGILKVDGDADWQEMQQWKVNSHVYADTLSVKLPPMVDIKASPDLQLTMTPDKAKISGDIHLPWGRIVVDELPASATTVSSDQIIVNRDLEPIKEQKPLPMLVETNVSVNIGNDFTLDAFGLKGNLTGQLNVSQRDNLPFIVGEVNILNGSYRSFGQDLVIQQGKILMNGPADKPYVSITAIRNPENIEDDVTAGIKVTGPAENPSVAIFSDPSMAQANALSYLLRGRNLDAESGDNSMTTTLIGLSLAQSGKVVGDIGQAFGVQDLQLDTAGSGDDSQVTVSGYVLPGLQVKYGVGIFNSVGEFTVRYRLMQDLYVEAISGLTSAVDLLYQFEFN